MIAWFIRFGTAIFGDTNLGVRFAGILAMLVTQLLLADIVRRVTHDARAIVFAVLMPVILSTLNSSSVRSPIQLSSNNKASSKSTRAALLTLSRSIGRSEKSLTSFSFDT